MPVSTERLTAEADESHAGLRLDRFLSGRFPELSRTRLQALIRQGHVALGRATIEDVKYPVKPGDRFKISVPPPVSAHPQAQEIPLNVVYEDDSIVVIDKPAGLVVHPGAGNIDRTLVNALIAHCGASLSGIGGVTRPGIVHRLDKDTSGPSSSLPRPTGPIAPSPSNSPITAASRSSAAISPLSGAPRRARMARSRRRSAGTRRAAPRWRSCPWREADVRR